jgi:hypothetical protein
MTVASRLTPLQDRILDALAGMQPVWTLFGAGALIGFHLGHRTTRDLDLAFRPRLELAEIPREVEARLRRAGLDVEHVQTALSFVRMRVKDNNESIELDLVADPTTPIESPMEVRPGVRDAAMRDGGFSPPTLAWLLAAFPLQRAREEGRDQVRLTAVRDRLLLALKA